MRIRLTELYDQNCEGKFHISREQVRQALSNPDSQQIMELDGLRLGFFVKHFIRPTEEFYVLACGRQVEDEWQVDLAFKVLPQLTVGLGGLQPLMLLQQLVQRFGLTIKIGQQLNRFIMREEIAIDRTSTDPIEFVEVLNPANHTVIQTMFVRIDDQDGKRIMKCALAYAIDADEYVAWLFGRKADQEVVVDIAPQLGGHSTPRDLIVSTGTINFWTSYSEIAPGKGGFLFRVLTKEYRLEVGFNETHFYIARNQDRLEIPIQPVYKPTGKVFCVAGWMPDQLTLSMLDEVYNEAIRSLSEDDRVQETEKRRHVLATLPTLPPNSLLAWARQNTIAPVTTFDLPGEFYQIVTDAIQSIQDKVSALGLQNPFWNITYAGTTVVSRKPKRETDIHPTIHGLLFDIAIAKNLEITPEYPIAAGRLDFLVSGVLTTGKIISVCVEFKHAHSDDLLHGLLRQLPAYMQAKGSDYGIYGVLFFKGPHFAEPPDYDKHSLEFFLYKGRLAVGYSNIRELILDFSYTKSPSKL